MSWIHVLQGTNPSFICPAMDKAGQSCDISSPSFSLGGLERPSWREKVECSLGTFEYQCGQTGWEGAQRREEARLRRASGRTEGEMERQRYRDRLREICHLLSVPPAPLSCILPGGKYTLMSEGDRGKGMSEAGGWRGGEANRRSEKMDRIEKETKKGEIEKEQDTVVE